MNRQFHNKRQSLTVWANYSTDQKNFTGHMFSIKLEETSFKMDFKALPVKIQRSKNRKAGYPNAFISSVPNNFHQTKAYFFILPTLLKVH